MSKAIVMLEVIAAFNAGRAIQGSPKGAEDWRDCPEPAWAWDRVDYRIKPVPNDVIPWDAIADEWQWAARDEDGRTFVYHVKPQISSVDTAWHGLDGVAASHVLKIEASERNWKDTLQKRPENPVERVQPAGVLEAPGMMKFETREALDDYIERITAPLPIAVPEPSHGVALHIQQLGRGRRYPCDVTVQPSEEERRASEMEQAPSFADRFARSIERRIHSIIPTHHKP